MCIMTSSPSLTLEEFVEVQQLRCIVDNLPPGYKQLCVGYFDDIRFSDEDCMEASTEPFLTERLGLSKPPQLVYYTLRFGADDTFKCAQVYVLLHDEDVRRDEVCNARFQMGMRWWEDELGNDRHDFHPQTMVSAFPPTWAGGRRGCDGEYA